ncbi:hypothetical protein BDW60DRAFT_195637 [Aspergillus nidulans var. acristatus]
MFQTHFYSLITVALGVAAVTLPTCIPTTVPTIITRTVTATATVPVTTTTTVTTTTCTSSAPTNIVPLYRAYNGNIYDHFYTTDLNEFNNAVQNLQYSDEQTACRLHPTAEQSTVPLYRMYSQSATDHFYTTSAEERDRAVQSLGYSDEGVAGYIYPQQSSVPGLVPLYRLYSGEVTDHFYTVSQTERDNTIGRLGYSDEGIAGYVFPPE